jgi:polyvinyl alcohol dehydrogenase (cytochrome)
MANRRSESEQHLEPTSRTFYQPCQSQESIPVFTTGGDVSVTPTVDGGAVYFPDWGGNLFAVKKSSGKLIWSHKISEYDGVDGAVSRVSPAVNNDQLIIGDILSSKQVHNGANVISIDRETGALRWITQVETHPAAIITGPPWSSTALFTLASLRPKKA